MALSFPDGDYWYASVEYGVVRSTVVLFIRLVDVLVRLEYGLVEFFLYFSSSWVWILQ